MTTRRMPTRARAVRSVEAQPSPGDARRRHAGPRAAAGRRAARSACAGARRRHGRRPAGGRAARGHGRGCDVGRPVDATVAARCRPGARHPCRRPSMRPRRGRGPRRPMPGADAASAETRTSHDRAPASAASSASRPGSWWSRRSASPSRCPATRQQGAADPTAAPSRPGRDPRRHRPDARGRRGRAVARRSQRHVPGVARRRAGGRPLPLAARRRLGLDGGCPTAPRSSWPASRHPSASASTCRCSGAARRPRPSRGARREAPEGRVLRRVVHRRAGASASRSAASPTSRSTTTPTCTACSSRCRSEYGLWWLVERRAAAVGDGVGCDGQRAGVARARCASCRSCSRRARDVQRGIDDLRLHRPRRARTSTTPSLTARPADGGTTILPVTLTHEPAAARRRPRRARAARSRPPAARAIPTSAEAAARLGWTHDHVQPQARQRVRQARQASASHGLRGGAGKLATNRRARLVEYAVATRLVSADDLALLDPATTAGGERAESPTIGSCPEFRRPVVAC